LGVAKNDILKFTVATDKMVVALGDEFTGGAEEVTKVMGGLRNIFSDIKSDKIDVDMLRIGNAVNVLASEGAATGPVLTDFANRIGGVGVSLGLSSAQVLGLSATLQELNVGTEKGGTAIVKILQRMTTHVKEFAKVADMDVKEFAALVNTDLFGAFTKVIEGSQKSGKNATALGAILDKLGVEGAGASEVVTKLGTNLNMLTGKVEVAGRALQGTDSIMEEFRLKNSTLGAEMDRLGKGLNSAFTNSGMSDSLKKLIGGLADVFDNTKKVSEVMREEQLIVNTLVIELKESNTTNERRKEIYDELAAINKDIVDGLDKENVSIERLNENLKIYNERSQNSILIQKKQEEIEEQNEESAERLAKRLDIESKARNQINKVLETQGEWSQRVSKINDNTNLSLLDKLNAISKVMTEISQKNNSWQANSFNANISGMAILLKSVERDHNKETQKGIELLKQKADLEKRYATNRLEGLDYSKKTEKELADIIHDNFISKGFYAKQAAAAQEELRKRHLESQKKANKDTSFYDEDAAKEAERKAKKHAEELKRIYDKLKSDVGDIKLENAAFSLDDYEKDVNEAWQEYDQLKQRIVANELMTEQEKSDAIIVIRTATINKLEQIDQKHFSDIEADLQEHLERYNELTKSEMQKEIDATIEKYDIEKAFFKNDAEKQFELEEWKQMELAKIRQKYHDKDAKKEKEKKKEEKDHTQEYVNEVMGFARSVQRYSQDLEDIRDQQISVQMAEADAKADRDMERERKRLDDKLISQKTYDDRVRKIENERKARERTERQRVAMLEKKNAKYNAYLNAAEAITNILSKHAANPWVAAGLTALTLAATYKQISEIEKIAIPQYARGGLHTGLKQPGGYVDQETMFRSNTSVPFIAGEQGAEWIAPNWMLRDPIAANHIGILEAARKSGRMYASGGVTSKNNSTPGSNETGTGYGLNDRICAALEMNTAVMREMMRNGVSAHISYDLLHKTNTSVDNARKSSSIG
jgi:TP901 family phage tail tape measure protein